MTMKRQGRVDEEKADVGESSHEQTETRQPRWTTRRQRLRGHFQRHLLSLLYASLIKKQPVASVRCHEFHSDIRIELILLHKADEKNPARSSEEYARTLEA